MMSVLALLMIGAATAQPFTFTPKAFAGEMTEPAQRKASGFTGFVFDFKKAKKVEGGTPTSSLRGNNVGSNPFLTTLPHRGNGQTLVTMGPCSGNSPHNHPRGSEISYMTYGKIQFGVIEENTAAGNTLTLKTIKQGQTIHVAQGLMHFSLNQGCSPAQFLANFGERDPGTQTTWGSFIQIPAPALHSATGIPESTWKALKKYKLAIAPTTGGEACLKKCGLTYDKANAFTGLPLQN